MTTHYAAAQVAELYGALETIRRPTGNESINVLEVARVRRPFPQKSTEASVERKTA
ncbi:MULTISPECIES: hypothetical protein [unclassified Cupriavidus]|uniref:hypothetical protein n=1 Tax=Cupriavidus sp. H19C3 TaxID=3241603 RepID=UPI003BF7AB77